MHFSTDINLGHILTATSLILTMFYMHHQNIKRLAEIEIKVKLLWRGYMKDHNDKANNDD